MSSKLADPTGQSPAQPPANDRRRTRAAVIRALIAIAVVAVWLGVAAIGGPAIGGLSSVQTNDATSFLPGDAESVKAAEVQAQFAAGQGAPAFVVFSSDTADQANIQEWTGFAGTIPSLTVGDTTLADYLQPAPLVPVPSQDGTSVLIVVPLSDMATAVDAEGERPLADIVQVLRDAAGAAAGPDAAAHVTGPAGYAADLTNAFAGIDGLLLIVALITVFAILIVVYRAVALPMVVLFNSISALALGGWLVYLLADADVITLNGQSQGILFILVVGAATDYGLLLTARYREELTRQATPAAALRSAWRACVEPILASGGTVIAGLLCLLLSGLNSNRSLGPIGAIGIACAMLAALSLLPALLLAGRWLFWPRIPHYRPEGQPATERRGLWARIAALVDRHPRRIWIITAAALGLACLAVPTLDASGTQQQDVFLNPADSVAGQQVIDEHFAAGIGDPVRVFVPEGESEAVVAALTGVDGVSQTQLTTDRATGAPVIVDGTVQLEVTTDSEQDPASVVTGVREAVHGVAPDALVGGTAAQQLDTVRTAQQDLRLVIPIVLAVVLLILMLLLRAVVAALLLTAATVLSFGAALGIAALVFENLFDFPAADPAVPLFAFVFLVALGVDYSIFLMSRAREEVLRNGPREGVLVALRVTGGVITSAGIVLAATFAALAVIPLVFMAQIAFIVAFGVLLDTFVVRSLLVPALAIDLGHRTWWPSRIARDHRSGQPGADAAARRSVVRIEATVDAPRPTGS